MNHHTPFVKKQSDRLTGIKCRVEQTLGEPLIWERINVGLTNQLYWARRGHKQDPAYVLRLNAPHDTVPGLDRDNELIILQAIKHFPWAVEVITQSDAHDWLLMPAYTQWAHHEHFAPTWRQQLLTAVAAYQTVSFDHPHIKKIEYAALLERYQHILIDNQHASNQAEIALWIQQCTHGLSRLPELPLCLTHHDLHPGNLCLDRQGTQAQIKLIDWEYAGMGHAWFDAHALLDTFNLSETEVSALPAFRHLPNADWQMGIAEIRIVSHALDHLWSNYRQVID